MSDTRAQVVAYQSIVERMKSTTSTWSTAAERIALGVAEMHAPEPGTFGLRGAYCNGCPGDSEWGAVDWPCDTAQLILNAR